MVVPVHVWFVIGLVQQVGRPEPQRPPSGEGKVRMSSDPRSIVLDSHSLFLDPPEGPTSAYERWTCDRCDREALVNGIHVFGEAADDFCRNPKKKKES